MLRKSIYFLVFMMLCVFSFASQAQGIDELFHSDGDPVLGHPQAGVTIVEFFDYQCSHCIDMEPIIQALLKANPKKIRIVLKGLAIRGPMSDFAARVALVALHQGKFDAFNNALFAANQPLSKHEILKIAEANNLDMKKLETDVNSKRTNQQMDANMQLAQELKIPGTPAFYVGRSDAQNINGLTLILGAASQEELQRLIDAASR
jgi:protein-disulfide isomerase